MADNQHISDKKAADLIKTMQAFSNLIDVYKVTDYMACATSAMREAKNGPDVVAQIKEKAGIDLEIVHGQKEAKIIYDSHAEQEIDKSKNYLYIDVGGGSTELSLFSAGELIASHSFNLGTIRILDNQDKEETWEEMREFIRKHTGKDTTECRRCIDYGQEVRCQSRVHATTDGIGWHVKERSKHADQLEEHGSNQKAVFWVLESRRQEESGFARW